MSKWTNMWSVVDNMTDEDFAIINCNVDRTQMVEASILEAWNLYNKDEDDNDVEFTGKAIEFESITLRMGTIMTRLYIVDEENNDRELVGTYSSRKRAEEVAHAIRWYSGSEDEISTAEFGPPIR